MNKYLLLGIIVMVILGAGVAYSVFLRSEERTPVTTGVVRDITITAVKNEWRFEPEVIEVNRGDKLVFTVINEDDYDHGIGLDAFGVSQRMPANSTIKLEFVATQAGEFPFYCSVPCGEGDAVIDGNPVHRTHFDMIGKIHVRSIISETK